jgi:hypothetical protein
MVIVYAWTGNLYERHIAIGLVGQPGRRLPHLKVYK